MTTKLKAHDVYDFVGKATPPAVGSPDSGPVVLDTDGSASAAAAAAGLVLTLDATNEVQNICAYLGDILSYDIDNLERVTFYVLTDASLADDAILSMGMASARNDDVNAIAAHASLRLINNNNLVAETDDGTTDNNLKATGETLKASLKRLVFDFSDGPSDVKFYVDDDNGRLQRVAQLTTFDMSGYAAGLQPYFQLQKASSTDTATATVRRIEVDHRLN